MSRGKGWGARKHKLQLFNPEGGCQKATCQTSNSACRLTSQIVSQWNEHMADLSGDLSGYRLGPFEMGQIRAHMYHGLGATGISRLLVKPDGKQKEVLLERHGHPERNGQA